jgi:hypothetical protein
VPSFDNSAFGHLSSFTTPALRLTCIASATPVVGPQEEVMRALMMGFSRIAADTPLNAQRLTFGFGYRF